MTLLKSFTSWLVSAATTLAAPAANLVSNSSFECGAGRGWHMANPTGTPKDNIVTGGYHGAKCLGLTAANNGMSPPLWLTAGVPYTFSWYQKANQANSFRYQIWRTKESSGGTGAWVLTPTSWARRMVQYTPTTTDYYQLSFYHFQPTMVVRIDAVQVEIGAGATDYAPQATLEAALETSAERNTFFSSDTKRVQVKWWNNGASTSNSVLYEIFDLWNRKTASGFLPATLPAGASTSTITLPSLNGWHRITTRIPTLDKSWDELTCAVVPFPPQSGARATGILGTHTDADAPQITFLRKLGFTWTRALSPSTLFRWQLREPAEDAYVWHDAGVTAISGNGMMVLGTLHGGLDFTGGPDWAQNNDGSLKLDKWANFCRNVVRRYKSQITHWEIWNEPHQSGTAWIQLAPNYAAILSAACAAIKSEDPAAKIIAIGGSPDEEWAKNVWDLLSATTRGQIDYVSCHLYPNDNSSDQNDPEYDPRHSEWRTKFAGIRPIWNTETGTWGYGGMLTENTIWSNDYQSAGPEWQRTEPGIRSRVSVDRIIRNFLRSAGHGFAKYFYYDSRQWSQNAVQATTPYSWEYSGSLRPTLVSLIIANNFIDQYRSITPLTHSSGAPLEIYLFDMGASRVAAIYNWDRLTRDITTAETSFKVYDVMGNAVPQPSGRIRVTRTPQYIVSTTLSVAQMTSVLQGAVVTVPDTTPPNVSIDIAPSGQWSGGTALLKWTGIDDTCVNSASYPSNITFAWKLDNQPYPAFGQTNLVQATIAAGNHTLWIKAKDGVGNVSEMSYQFEPSITP